MGAQIYTAVEARAIVSACRAQRETWRQIGAHDPAFRVDAEYRARIDREESLAASVEHHAARAERAEAERDAAIKRATNAERMRDAFVATSVAFAVDMIDKPDAMARCAAERDAAVAQAEELTRALRVTQSDLARALADGRVELRQRADDAERVAADLRDDLERLRAIIEGRTTPPTDAEMEAHVAPGRSGWWLVSSPDDMSLELIEQPSERDWCIEWGATQWLPIDLDGRPCAWPVVTEAPSR